jgi:hypothetical protein
MGFFSILFERRCYNQKTWFDRRGLKPFQSISPG